MFNIIYPPPPFFALSGWGCFLRDTSLCLLAWNIPYWWCTCKANQIQARDSDLLTRLKYYTPDLHNQQGIFEAKIRKSLSKTSPVAGSHERCIHVYNARYRWHKLITSIICSSRFFVSWMVYGNVWLTMYWSCSTFIVDSTISLTISTTNSSPSSCSTIWCLEIHKMER